MRSIILAVLLTLSGLSHAQQKAKFYYQRSLIIGEKALDETLEIFNQRIRDASPKEDSLKAGLSQEQIGKLYEMHQVLREQPITSQEVYTKEKDEILLMPADTYVLKFNLNKGIYTMGYRFIDAGKETISFDPTEKELTKVVTSFTRTDSLRSFNDYECVMFLLTIQNEQEPNTMMAKENVVVWATRSIQPSLPVQALLMLKNPVKEMENYTPVVMSISSPAFQSAKDVIVLEKVD
jgi:hypothetical protein